MSDRFTVIDLPGCDGIGERGHVSHAEMVSLARIHYARVATEARDALHAIESGNYKVFHQRGIAIARDRKEVRP